MIEFQRFPKIPRMFRDIVITEKIDGTNGAIGIIDADAELAGEIAKTLFVVTYSESADDKCYLVYAQSRNRIIIPEADNYGFARWVYENSETLIADLGPGLHYGEWWGRGIGRKYGLDHNRFSLFNVKRWADCRNDFKTPCLDVVPVMYRGPFSTGIVTNAIDTLQLGGSLASPGFGNPEGVVVYHSAGNTLFKVTVQNDALSKSELAMAA